MAASSNRGAEAAAASMAAGRQRRRLRRRRRRRLQRPLILLRPRPPPRPPSSRSPSPFFWPFPRRASGVSPLRRRRRRRPGGGRAGLAHPGSRSFPSAPSAGPRRPRRPPAPDAIAGPRKPKIAAAGGSDGARLEKSAAVAAASSARPASAGEAVRLADAADELLDVAARYLWLPSDPGLPPHLRTQAVHHEKRQRWGSQLLVKLGSAPLRGLDDATPMASSVWGDERLARAVLAAALSFEGDGDGTAAAADRPEKEGRWIRSALCGLQALAGHAPPPPPPPAGGAAALRPDLREGARRLIRRTEGLAPELPLREAVEARWAARGLLARLGPRVAPTSAAGGDGGDGDEDDDGVGAGGESQLDLDLARLLPNLEARVAELPFNVLPCAVDLRGELGLPRDADVVPSARPCRSASIPSPPGPAPSPWSAFRAQRVATGTQDDEGGVGAAEDGRGAVPTVLVGGVSRYSPSWDSPSNDLARRATVLCWKWVFVGSGGGGSAPGGRGT